MWVPSLKPACATDVAFLDCHIWMTESKVERRKAWRTSIEKLRDFDAEIIIPGHISPAKQATRDTSCIDWSLRRIDVYNDVLAGAKTGLDLWEGMDKAYPRHEERELRGPMVCAHAVPEELPRLVHEAAGQAGDHLSRSQRGFCRRSAARVE